MKPDIIHAQSSRAHTHLRLAALLPGYFPPIVVSRRVAFPVSKGPWGRFKYRSGISHYIPISRAAAASLGDAGISDAMMTVVPSGVDVKRYASAEGERGLLDRWGIRKGAFLVGTAAAFEREKGHRFLIEAARIICQRHPACTFVFIGSGRLEAKLRASAASLGLEKRIVFAGFDMPLEKMLPLFDLYVLPSLAEGLSSALIAAMSAGLPIVASRTGGIPELLDDGIGQLVPASDAVALSDAILELVENADRRREMAGRARISARRFDISGMISGTEAVYRSVIEKIK